MKRHCLAFVSLIVLALGCGEGDSTGSNDPFPNVAGVYAVTGGFDGLPSNQASFTGTLTLNQTSTQAGTLTGTGQITATINGQTIGGSLPLQQSSVSPTGQITFLVNDGSGSWTFTGQYSGQSITNGRHTLTDGQTTINGSWQGTKQ
jgi:hypothetical protein